MRFLVRFVGLVALAGAFAAAVLDGARWIADGAWAPVSTAAALEWIAPRALIALRHFVDARFGAWASNEVMVTALVTPAFAALTVISAVLFLISRPRPTEIDAVAPDR